MQAFRGAPPFSQLPRGSIKHLSHARKKARKLVHHGVSLFHWFGLASEPSASRFASSECRGELKQILGLFLGLPSPFSLLIHIWILLLTSMSTTLAGPPLPLTDRMLPISYLLISALCLCHGPFSVSSVFYVVVFYARVLCFHHFHSPLSFFQLPHTPLKFISCTYAYVCVHPTILIHWVLF